MDLKRIKALLEKYYKGETNIEEEHILREYFSGSSVDPQFTADKDIFLYQVHETDDSQNMPDISNKIWDSINKEKTHNQKKNNRLLFITLRIAASVIIIFGSYLVIKNQVLNSEQEQMMVDTYDNPEEAYKQAKETLLYVSALLNNGTEHLESIHKINAGTQKLNSISTFNKGLEELKPIQKYNKADKYFKQ